MVELSFTLTSERLVALESVIEFKIIYQHNQIKHDGEYVLKLKGISMLEPDVITILSDNVETIKAELADPLHQLTIHLTIE